MNSYYIHGVEMTAERIETTHTLLRSKQDTTRWIANELLACYAPVTDLSNVLRRPERLALIYGDVGAGKTMLAEKFEHLSGFVDMPRVSIIDADYDKTGQVQRTRHAAGDFVFVLMMCLYPSYKVLVNFPIHIRCFKRDGKYEYTIS